VGGWVGGGWGGGAKGPKVEVRGGNLGVPSPCSPKPKTELPHVNLKGGGCLCVRLLDPPPHPATPPTHLLVACRVFSTLPPPHTPPPPTCLFPPSYTGRRLCPARRMRSSRSSFTSASLGSRKTCGRGAGGGGGGLRRNKRQSG
jgi:hypothetical protein